MTKLSRREIVKATLALPVAPQGLISTVPATPPWAVQVDTVLAAVDAWIAKDVCVTAMQLEWQRYENVVFDRARRMKIGCERACQSNWPEARAMRALDLEIKAAYPHLARLAWDVRQLRALTIAGAVAKIQLGLQVQGPYDWQEHAFELVEGGLVDLRKLTGLV